MSDLAAAAERLCAIRRYDLAAECYRKLLELWPMNMHARERLVIILWAGGHREAAEHELARALELDPSSCSAHHAAARLLRWKGEPKQAVEAARRAIALHPNGDRHHLELSYALDAIGDQEGALAAVDGALRLDPVDASGLTQRTHLLIDLGRDAEAWQASDMLLGIAPDSAYGHSCRGLLHERKQEFALAEERYLAALAIDPEDKWTPGRLAHVRTVVRFDSPKSVPRATGGFDTPTLLAATLVSGVVTWLILRLLHGLN